MNDSRILILGDLAPVGAAQSHFSIGKGDWFASGLESYWGGADFRVVKLVCPITASPSPINKIGPCLGVEGESADALRGFSLVSLANNHILDHGPEGLTHTTRLLDTANIAYSDIIVAGLKAGAYYQEEL